MGKMTVPKGEQIRVSYLNGDRVLCFLVTEKPNIGFSLYEVSADGLKRIGKARSPVELERKYDVLRKVGIKT